MCLDITSYHECGNICWAKHSDTLKHSFTQTFTLKHTLSMGFSPIKFLREYFHSALASGVYYLTLAKYTQENFHGILKNHKSQIFPHLW